MKHILNLSLAAALIAASTLSTPSTAFAERRQHEPQPVNCVTRDDAGKILVLALVLGAVTGGVGSAVAYGGAYWVGGAAIGGGAGTLLGVVHTQNRCM